MILNLHRIEVSEAYIRGVMTLESVPIWATLELPWRDNARQISCIPTGLYSIMRRDSLKFGKCLAVRGVPNRDGILIHAGNTVKDTHGCILVGEVYIPNGIAQSREGLKRLLETVGDYGEVSIKIH
jgi:hypothetical protein